MLSATPGLPGYLLSETHHHPDRVMALIRSITGSTPTEVAGPILSKLEAQIEERVGEGTMRPIAPEQFMINLISLCIFPFAARPLLSGFLGLDPPAFDRLIEDRKRLLADFFLTALRP